MPTYSYPGVYIQEVPSGPAPIVGTSPSTLAVVGFTLEGPTQTPTLVTSFTEFVEKFGGFTSLSSTPTAAYAFFANGGQLMRVVRVVGAGAAKADTSYSEPAAGPGTGSPLGEAMTEDVAADGGLLTMTFTGLNVLDFLPVAAAVPPTVGLTITVTGGGAVVSYEDQVGVGTLVGLNAGGVSVPGATGTVDYITGEVTLTFPVAPIVGSTFTAIYSRTNIKADMLWEGAAGNNYRLQLTGDPNFENLATASYSRYVLEVQEQDDNFNFVGQETFEGLVLDDPTSDDFIKTVVNAASDLISLTTYPATSDPAALNGTAVAAEDIIASAAPAFDSVQKQFSFNTASLVAPTTFRATVALVYAGGAIPAPADQLIIEDDGRGGIQVASDSPGTCPYTLDTNGINTISYLTNSANINVMFKFIANPAIGPDLDATNAFACDYFAQAASSSLLASMLNGADGAATTRTEISAPALAADSKGLFALNKVEDLLQVIIPDFETDATVSKDLIDYCDTRKDRFAIVSVPEGFTPNDAVQYKQATLNKSSNRAAIYYPHVTIIDPVTNKQANFPGGSLAAGIYARTDATRNVSKAPAGTVDGALRFATGVETEMTPAQSGVINLAHVNGIVNFPFTGLCLWGARTLDAAGEFPYIQMRRMFMYVEKAVFDSTQGFVFESNTAGLRAQVKGLVESFLLGLFNQGYFSGSTPAQAFFVVCDDSNNPPASVAKGQLFVDVGLAPTRPAEFIVFRFQQKTLEG